MSAHSRGNSRQRLGGGADVVHLDAGYPQPDDRAGHRHPVIGIGTPGARPQRCRGDHQAVGGFLTVAAQAVDLGAQRGEPVGLVATQMGDAAQP